MQPKCLHNKPLILLLLSLPLLWFSCQESSSPPQVEKDNSRMETPAGAYAYIKAQKRLPFEIFRSEDGLCSNTVQALLLDSRGFLWIATDDGLNRYDGHSFRQYRNDPIDPYSLADNAILDLAEDSRGDIWLLTLEEGLCRLNVAKEQFTTYSDTSVMTRLGYPGMRMGMDEQDKIWLNYPLAYFDIGKEQFVKASDKNAQCFGSDINGNFYAVIAERKGVSSLARLDFRINSFQVLAWDSLGILSSTNDMKGAPDGGIWIGTQHGFLCKYLPEEDSLMNYGRHIARSTIKGLFPSPDGRLLWLATWGGLVRFAPFSQSQDTVIRYRPNETDPKSLPVGQVLDVLLDRQGNIWAATMGGGLCKYAPAKNRFQHFTHYPGDSTSLSDKNVECIFEDSKGRLWVGTKRGLNLMDREKGTFEVFQNNTRPACAPNMVTAVAEDTSSGVLYVGFWGDGIRVFNPETGQFSLPEVANMALEERLEKNPCLGFIRDFAWRQDGAICASNWGSVIDVYRPESKTLHLFAKDTLNPTFLSNLTGFIYTSHEGVLWMGNTEGKGLQSLDWRQGEAHCIYDYATKQRLPFQGTLSSFLPDPSDSTKLASGIINYIFEDSKKRLWLGTPKGLHLLDRPTGTFRRFGIQNGFPNETINSMLEDDDGYLWATTNRGLCQFDPALEQVVNTFDLNHGLQGNQFSLACFKNKRGELFFGGPNGFNVFHPDSLAFNDRAPDLCFTRLTVNGIPQPTEFSGLSFTYDKKNFFFEFTALDFSAPSSHLYQYHLDGFDRGWTKPSPEHFAVYTNLPPGNYVMRVKGCNSDKTWNEAGIQLPFTIQKPWWASWWFRTLMLLFLAATGWLFWRRRARKIRQKQEDQEKLIKYLQVQTLQAQMNPHFLFNVLASLQNLILRSDTKKADHYLVNLSKLIRSYLNSSLKSDYSKGYSSENEITLAEELELLEMYIEFEKLQYKNKLEYHIEYDENRIVPENRTIPPMLLQPYVENAIKHGIMYKKGKGSLWIQILESQENEGIVIIIKDNGVGIEKAREIQRQSVRRYKSKGRELAEKRIEVLQELGYPIEVNTVSSDQGTAVTIKIG